MKNDLNERIKQYLDNKLKEIKEKKLKAIKEQQYELATKLRDEEKELLDLLE